MSLSQDLFNRPAEAPYEDATTTPQGSPRKRKLKERSPTTPPSPPIQESPSIKSELATPTSRLKSSSFSARRRPRLDLDELHSSPLTSSCANQTSELASSNGLKPLPSDNHDENVLLTWSLPSPNTKRTREEPMSFLPKDSAHHEAPLSSSFSRMPSGAEDPQASLDDVFSDLRSSVRPAIYSLAAPAKQADTPSKNFETSSTSSILSVGKMIQGHVSSRRDRLPLSWQSSRPATPESRPLEYSSAHKLDVMSSLEEVADHSPSYVAQELPPHQFLSESKSELEVPSADVSSSTSEPNPVLESDNGSETSRLSLSTTGSPPWLQSRNMFNAEQEGAEGVSRFSVVPLPPPSSYSSVNNDATTPHPTHAPVVGGTYRGSSYQAVPLTWGPSKASQIVYVFSKSNEAPSNSPPDWILVGPRYTPVEEDGELGNGAFGEVRKMVDTEQNTVVAVKGIPWGQKKQPTHVQVLREILIHRLATGNDPEACHPNILAYIGRVMEKNVAFLVMKFCPGKSIEELYTIWSEEATITRTALRNGPLRRIATQMCDGLVFLKSEGIVHRDIKPENVLVFGEGLRDVNANIKIIDFGLSFQLDDPVPENVRKEKKTGTHPFWAPEVMDVSLASSDGYSYEIDWWSLAILLLYLGTATLPRGWNNNPRAGIGAESKDMKALEASGNLSEAAKKAIRGLMTVDYRTRWTPEDVLAHRWIAGNGSA